MDTSPLSERVWCYCTVCDRVGYAMWKDTINTPCDLHPRATGRVECKGLVTAFSETRQAQIDAAFRLGDFDAAIELCQAIRTAMYDR